LEKFAGELRNAVFGERLRGWDARKSSQLTDVREIERLKRTNLRNSMSEWSFPLLPDMSLGRSVCCKKEVRLFAFIPWVSFLRYTEIQ
jgi:hypothetical protein